MVQHIDEQHGRLDYSGISGEGIPNQRLEIQAPLRDAIESPRGSRGGSSDKSPLAISQIISLEEY